MRQYWPSQCQWVTLATYIEIQLAVVSPLILASRFGVLVALVNQKVVRQHVERHSREVELKEAGCLTGIA
jgi:hypothetical protein